MPFLEKLADIAVSGRHVGDMSATFPAKPMDSHTIVMADHAQLTNYGMKNIGIGTCLDERALRILMRVR
jgi:hypothetical protein